MNTLLKKSDRALKEASFAFLVDTLPSFTFLLRHLLLVHQRVSILHIPRPSFDPQWRQQSDSLTKYLYRPLLKMDTCRSWSWV